MKLQTSTRLAIFAVLELAEGEGLQLSVADIGQKYGFSSHHLAKVMRVLTRAGLVRSVRGARGGYQFVGNPRRTTLLDIVQLFEDFDAFEDEIDTAQATAEGGALRKILSEIDSITRATLGSVTIVTMRDLVSRQSNTDGARPKGLRQRNRSHLNRNVRL